MKNLHKINTTLPDWVKLLILAWRDTNGKEIFIYNTKNGFAYPKGVGSLSQDGEERWLLRGWGKYMEDQDVSNFDYSYVEII